MQIGIRLHDVNSALSPEQQTMENRAKKAAAEGFSCVHLALSKVIKGFTFDDSAMTEGLGHYVKRVFSREGLDIAVLGCYLNLAHPDPEKLREIQSRYFGSIRIASLMGAGVVGTETGCPNAEYKLDLNTHTEEALNIFLRGLEPVVEEAERRGVTLAIEPVWNHIVCNGQRAQKVLKSIGSRSLRIILDPVNLLYEGNADRKDAVIADAIERVGEQVAVIHLKDYTYENGRLKSIAAGTGQMDYRRVLAFAKERKPYIQATLENTANENAVASRQFIERLYSEI